MMRRKGGWRSVWSLTRKREGVLKTMPNVVAMIPVLLGSKRVPDKNLILVDGRVLCAYTIEACKESEAFTDVYLNSEDEIFESIAEQEQAKFHQRPAEFGGRACRQKTKSRD